MSGGRKTGDTKHPVMSIHDSGHMEILVGVDATENVRAITVMLSHDVSPGYQCKVASPSAIAWTRQ